MSPLRKFSALALALGAAACATTDPEIVYRTQQVAVTANQGMLRCPIPPRPPAMDTMTQEEFDRWATLMFAIYNTCYESVEAFKNELNRIESQVNSGNSN